MYRERKLSVRELREGLGISQTRLAAIAELNPTTVNQIEQGTRQPSARTLAKLADALHVTVPELFAEEEEKTDVPLEVGSPAA